MLPLAGPEEFDDEDNDKLPVSLQYLPETKEREQDLDIRWERDFIYYFKENEILKLMVIHRNYFRIMLLEALTQLCATKKGREILREKNTYVILREYHKWEKNKNALLACENVVDILIKY